MLTKKCKECGIIKNIEEFYKRLDNNDGYNHKCKQCIKEYDVKYYNKNKEIIRIKHAVYDIKNAEKIKLRKKVYRQTEKGKEVSNRNSKKCRENPNYKKYMREYSKEYRARKNNFVYKENQRRADRKKLSTPKGKIDNSISCGIRGSLRDGKHGRHWEDIVGYSLQELMDHLESQFIDDMTWDSYGRKKGGWSIDHIKPISSFNFDNYNDEEFKQCWSLSNLQPLDHIENIKKSNKIA